MMLRRSPVKPAGQAAAVSAPVGRRHVCAPLCAKKGKQQGSVKMSKRGKPSSRPGPPGRSGSGLPVPPPAMEQQQQQQAAAASAPPAPQPPQAAAAHQQLAQQQQRAPPAPQQAAAGPSSGSSGVGGARGGRQVAETPQVVVDRMLRRVITFAGLPVLTGVVLFPLFWYLRVVQKVEYPIWVVYVTQAFMFGGGLAGISYGILSTSWDPRREGSALGWTELQANLPLLLNRNKDEQQGQ